MLDALGRKIIVNDKVAYSFIWDNKAVLIWGKVLEAWESGIVVQYENDRVVIENSATTVILMGLGYESELEW